MENLTAEDTKTNLGESFPPPVHLSSAVPLFLVTLLFYVFFVPPLCTLRLSMLFLLTGLGEDAYDDDGYTLVPCVLKIFVNIK